MYCTIWKTEKMHCAKRTVYGSRQLLVLLFYKSFWHERRRTHHGYVTPRASRVLCQGSRARSMASSMPTPSHRTWVRRKGQTQICSMWARSRSRPLANTRSLVRKRSTKSTKHRVQETKLIRSFTPYKLSVQSPSPSLYTQYCRRIAERRTRKDTPCILTQSRGPLGTLFLAQHRNLGLLPLQPMRLSMKS